MLAVTKPKKKRNAKRTKLEPFGFAVFDGEQWFATADAALAGRMAAAGHEVNQLYLLRKQ